MFRSSMFVTLICAAPAYAEPAVYPTPEAAVGAFVDALNAQDHGALLTVFGAESDDLISSGDPKQDADARDEFLAAYQSFAEIVDDGEGRKELQVGRTRWAFPVSLVAVGGGWHFDPDAAREEILDRRIGQNELDVIEILHRAVEIQANYRKIDYDGDGVLEFADAILSEPGKRDGLYWPDEAGTPKSPVGAFIAQATADGVSIDGVDQSPVPYSGYYFRILTRQGPSAPGGELDYIVNGNMLAGHALLAFPAIPGQTGVMSFMVGESGIVYEADLGASTLDVAGAIDSFDPGEGWHPVLGP